MLTIAHIFSDISPFENNYFSQLISPFENKFTCRLTLMIFQYPLCVEISTCCVFYFNTGKILKNH